MVSLMMNLYALTILVGLVKKSVEITASEDINAMNESTVNQVIEVVNIYVAFTIKNCCLFFTGNLVKNSSPY
jgi:hypothetical protein